jgi:hypothetical protein
VAETPDDPRPEMSEVIAVQFIAGFWPFLPWCYTSIVSFTVWLSSFILHPSSFKNTQRFAGVSAF